MYYLPDAYELPGGHIDFGEDFVDGLKREIKEEFNMSVTIGSPFAAFTYMNDVKKSHSIEVIYFATFGGDESKLQLNPADHSEFRWVSLEDLPQIFAAGKNEDDIEFRYVRQGLELLAGKKLDFGLLK